VGRVLELLEVAGDGPVIQSLRRRLFSSDPAQRGPALRLLALACPGAEDMVDELEPLVSGRSLGSSEEGGEGEATTLLRLARDPNPFLRAAAVWAGAGLSDTAVQQSLGDAREDDHPLVRETASDVASREVHESPDGRSLSSIEAMYFLHVSPFFAALDPGDLYDLSQFAIEETVAPPAAICEAGDAGDDALFVVLDGRASVVTERAGEERALATLGRGDLIGELSVLDGSPRSASVRPEEGPVRVLRIPGPSLRGILLHRPRVAESLLGILAGRIRSLVSQGSASR
jgi:CRP-like cAMP-binding protein